MLSAKIVTIVSIFHPFSLFATTVILATSKMVLHWVFSAMSSKLYSFAAFLAGSLVSLSVFFCPFENKISASCDPFDSAYLTPEVSTKMSKPVKQLTGVGGGGLGLGLGPGPVEE